MLCAWTWREHTMAGDNVEARVIEEAFEERVRVLFMGLATNLGDMPVSHKTEQQCIDTFKTGLNTAKKARRLALDAVGNVLPA
jgi:hypothetical protein